MRLLTQVIFHFDFEREDIATDAYKIFLDWSGLTVCGWDVQKGFLQWNQYDYILPVFWAEASIRDSSPHHWIDCPSSVVQEFSAQGDKGWMEGLNEALGWQVKSDFYNDQI